VSGYRRWDLGISQDFIENGLDMGPTITDDEEWDFCEDANSINRKFGENGIFEYVFMMTSKKQVQHP